MKEKKILKRLKLWQFTCHGCGCIWFIETDGVRPVCRYCPKCGGKLGEKNERKEN